MPSPYGIPITKESRSRELMNILDDEHNRQARSMIQRHKEMQLLEQMLTLYADIQRVLDTDDRQGDSFVELSMLADGLLDPARHTLFKKKSHVRQHASLALDTLGNPLAPIRRGIKLALRKRMSRHGLNERWNAVHGRIGDTVDAVDAWKGAPGQYGISMPTGMNQAFAVLNPMAVILPSAMAPLTEETRQWASPLLKLLGPLTSISRLLINYPSLLALYAIKDRYTDKHNPGCDCLHTLLPELIESRERTYFNAAVGRHSVVNVANLTATAAGRSLFLPPQPMTPRQRASMLLANALGESGASHPHALRLAGWPDWKGCPLAMLILAAVCAAGEPRQGAKKAVVAMCAREETAIAAILDYM